MKFTKDPAQPVSLDRLVSIVTLTQEIPLVPGEKARLIRSMSNWVKLAKEIYGTDNLEELMRMLRVELESLARPYIINRLYSRMNKIRSQIEKRELNKCLHESFQREQAKKNQKRQQNAILRKELKKKEVLLKNGALQTSEESPTESVSSPEESSLSK